MNHHLPKSCLALAVLCAIVVPAATHRSLRAEVPAETGSSAVSTPVQTQPAQTQPAQTKFAQAPTVQTPPAEAPPAEAPIAEGPSAPALPMPLAAEDLLLVYNLNDEHSKELAEYYAQARSVPADRLLAIRANPLMEEISRENFEQQIHDPIRACLQQQPFGRRVRCIVLFYGVPIRVGAKQATAADKRLAEEWQQEVRQTIAKLGEATASLEAVASPAAAESSPADTAPADADAADDGEAALGAKLARYEEARNNAARRIDASRTSATSRQDFVRLMGLIQSVEGVQSVVARARASSNLASENTAQIEKVSRQLEADEAQIIELRRRDLDDPARREAGRLILQNHGILGYLKSLVYDLALTRTAETTASVDSELTLVLWPQYVLYRWVPNLLSWQVRGSPHLLTNITQDQRQTPVLMTCRIDGPSVRVARRIIDDSIAAESTGLSGKVYLDARGLHDDKAFGEYDDDLRQLAAVLARETHLPIKLDDKSGVFAAGACPNAMLYCGWYSLRNFVDAFEFVPGAVGYHIASFEAISIHAGIEKGWVKGLLDDGVAATLGAVADPYLQSFPKPTQFFGLLLTGRFTLAECYAYTADFNSWMMLLIGDPLYRPFAAAPLLSLEQVYEPQRTPPEFRTQPDGK